MSLEKHDDFGVFRSYLDDMRRDGAVVVIQIGDSPVVGAEGEYSVMISGDRLAYDHISVVADTLAGALLRAIDSYAQKAWQFDEALAQDLRESLTATPVGTKDDVDTCIPCLEKMKSEGAVVLVKFDGQRGQGDNGPFTAAVRGGLLNDDFIRIDADSLAEAVAYVVVEYARRCWQFSG
jgi:alpha-D-ribose 1-methylphosphonate 5-triphosphate synthase subunit PhnI